MIGITSIKLFFSALLESLIPYAITFWPNATASSDMKPMNVSTYSCGDISLGCSCGDCPSSSVCSNSASTTTNKKDSCSVKVGTLMVREHIKMIMIFTRCIHFLFDMMNKMWFKKPTVYY